MKALVINVFKIRFSLYARSFWQFKEFFFPGISVSLRHGDIGKWVDFEVKILCFGIGINILKRRNENTKATSV